MKPPKRPICLAPASWECGGNLARRGRIVVLPTWLPCAAMVVLLAGPPHAALADTIYLVNGRVIHSASVRVDGDRVVFRQLGGEVSIPCSQVLRIVDDDEVEQPARRAGVTRAAAETTDDANAETEAAGASTTAAGAPDAGDAATGAPGDTEDPSTAAYWVRQIRAVDERIARAEAELAPLPEYDAADRRLLRFSGQALYFMAERDRWEKMLRDFQATRRRLLDGARRAGIPPGALRDGLAKAAAGGSGGN